MGSDRAQAHRLIVGGTQSGKTTATRRVLREVDRYVVVDPKGAYDDLGTVCGSWGECRDYLDRHAERETLRLVVGAPDEETNLAVIRYLWTLHSELTTPKTLLAIDEAHRWTPGGRFPTADSFGTLAVDARGKSYLELAYTEGLQHRLTVLTVTQFPQQLPTRTRGLADHKYSFRMRSRLPVDFRHAFGDRYEELADLEVLTPGTEPQEGVHYLAYPEGLDLLEDVRREMKE